MTTQRDRLAAVLHADHYSCTIDHLAEADALLARGVRVVDAGTLARALHETTRGFLEHETADPAFCRTLSERILAALDAEPDR